MEELNELEKELNQIATFEEDPGGDTEEISKLLEEFPEINVPEPEPQIKKKRAKATPKVEEEREITHYTVGHAHCEICGQCLIVGDGHSGYWHRCTGDPVGYQRAILMFNSYKPKSN
jgi:hypothetical protein